MPRHRSSASPSYPAHLQPLLTLGDPRRDGQGWRERVEFWTDYRTLGPAESDAPDLIRMACDKSLHHSPEPTCWAPLHAWRALGQLRSRDAIKPLIELLDVLAMDDDDWALEELPEVIAMLGPEALPDLRRRVPDQRRNMWGRLAAAQAMTLLALAEPTHRPEVVRVLTAQLDLARYNDPDFNGLIIAKLVDLKAVEAADAIQGVYENGGVEERTCGPLEDVLADLGMITEKLPLCSGDARTREVFAQVIADYNAKLKSEPPSKKPLSRAEHEKSMRELTAMLRARLSGAPAPAEDPSDPNHRAQDLAYAAADADDPAAALQLLEQALALDPDCVDAIAQHTALTATSEPERLAGFRRAVAAGERTLGPELLGSCSGELWAHLEARPYLRARIRLANALRESPDTLDAAIAEYQAIIALDNDDHSGVRYALVACHLQRGDTAAVQELAFRFDEASAFFLWPEALAHALKGAEDDDAADSLQLAREANPHVDALLTGDTPMPALPPPFYSPGSADEAFFVAENLLPALRTHPRLREWLAAHPCPTVRGRGIRTVR